jgi:predicted kinase
MITHGYSGSGKTTFSRYAVELLDAIQLRSDVERKRMHGLAATSRPGSAPEAQLYSAEATQRTYERLLELARCVVGAGWTVIVDAAFLMAAQRRLFRDLAVECGVPFVIFDVQASRAAMASRVTARAATDADASDAGVEVLERQLSSGEALGDDEIAHAVVVDMEGGMDAERARKICNGFPR